MGNPFDPWGATRASFDDLEETPLPEMSRKRPREHFSVERLERQRQAILARKAKQRESLLRRRRQAGVGHVRITPAERDRIRQLIARLELTAHPEDARLVTRLLRSWEQRQRKGERPNLP